MSIVELEARYGTGSLSCKGNLFRVFICLNRYHSPLGSIIDKVNSFILLSPPHHKNQYFYMYVIVYNIVLSYYKRKTIILFFPNRSIQSK